MTLVGKFVNGLFVGVEGIDGSGKTVFTQNLATMLETSGCLNFLTREPGGTKFGLQLRQILQYRDEIGELDAKAEYLLFAADRAQHFRQVVVPGLQAGKVVISDRTGDSSLVYQGYGHGLDLNMIAQVNAWAMNYIKPNLTIYLRIDAQTAKDRVAQRAEKLTAFEQMGPVFLNKIIQGFDTIYANRADVLILDGSLPTNVLVAQALNSIMKMRS